MIGRTISHFRILEKLGEGGMGLVYRAEDERLRRPVALKTLRPEALGDEERRRRLLREARAAAALTHPNIAAVYEAGEVDGMVFVAMELVEGETLRARLAREERLALADVLSFGRQIASGLAEAHEARLVHRDLKPENVVVTEAGGRGAPARGAPARVKILDFGLVKTVACEPLDSGAETPTAPLTGDGAVLGTVAYMSPEQARGRDVDQRSDLFSMGALLYEMLTGRPPFAGTSAIATVSAILQERPTPIAELRGDVPPELSRIVDELLIKDPDARYHSAHNLALALAGLESSPRPGSSPAGPATGAVERLQDKLCVCGRSKKLPLCDGSHASDDWSCAADPAAARYVFCASRRYQNLARKLASHYQGLTCLEGEDCPGAETFVVLVDGTDLDFPLAASAGVDPARRLVVTLGVSAGVLGGLFPGSPIADLGDVEPLYAFKRISALLDGGAGRPAAGEAMPRRALRSAFISHAVADEPLILPVKAYLERYYGADIFTCADSIAPGSEWQTEITQALRQKSCFVYALSAASLASHFCSFEAGVAVALDKPVRLVSLDGSRPPVFIQHLQTVDLERIARTRPWLELHDILLEELLAIMS